MGASATKQSIVNGDLVTSRRLMPAYSIWLIIFALAIVGCQSTQYPAAPVVDRTLTDSQTPQASTDSMADEHEQSYIVQRGDTLYSIALDHGINLGELAEWNNISNPGAIKPGQRISLSVPSRQAQQPMLIALPHQSLPTSETIEGETIHRLSREEKDAQIIHEPKAHILPYSDQAVVQLQELAHPALITPSSALNNQDATITAHQSSRIENAPEPVNKASSAVLNSSKIDWIWPTDGRLLEGFSAQSKGVRIAGRVGQPVLASAAGQVVYSGSGLRGYGKLLIIKHNNTYLSAYAHNSKILVLEGDAVTKGQKIAEMGNSDTDTVKLHFEIRKNGKPVDPLKFLPGRSG